MKNTNPLASKIMTMAITLSVVIIFVLIGARVYAVNHLKSSTIQEVAGVNQSPSNTPSNTPSPETIITTAPVKKYYKTIATPTQTMQPMQQQQQVQQARPQTQYTTYQSEPMINCEVKCYDKINTYNTTASLCTTMQQTAANTCVNSNTQNNQITAAPTTSPQQPVVNTQACHSAYQQADINSNQLSQGAKAAMMEIAKSNLDACLAGN